MPAQITGFSTYPQRTQPATFSADMDTHITELAQFVTEANALSTEISESASSVAAAITDAIGAATSASMASGATRWVAGGTYNLGDVVWSPLNNQTYRAKVTMGTLLHSYWRLNISDVWDGSGTSISLQYLTMRSTSGGSNLCTGGTPFCSATPTSGTLSNLYGTTGNLFRMPGTSGQIGYHFATPVMVSEYVVAVHNSLYYGSESPRNWTLEWSDDGSSWVAVQYSTNQTNWTANQSRTFTAIVPGATDPSMDSTNWQQISGTPNADTVDTFHASQTPTAGQIPVVKNDGTTAFPGAISVGNATQSGTTSTLLNWYEVGTFAPVPSGSTTTGAVTYTKQIGRYTRIGNRVFFSIGLAWSANASTGNIAITGLPFAANNTASNSFTSSVYYNSLLTVAGKQLSAVIAAGATSITLWACDPSGSTPTAVAMDTAVSDLVITGSYEV